MGIILEMAIAFYILVKLFCIINDPIHEKVITIVATLGAIVTCAAIIILAIRVTIIALGPLTSFM